ncbi:MAG: ABC transporter substrate-binding protein [Bowdeniella nasicola]|nr:ABC transporter substrate-binding protein [Bowdeniella nasicola]
MRKTLAAVATFAVSTTMLVGCGGDPSSDEASSAPAPETDQTSEESTSEGGDAFPVTVKHAQGELTIEEQPEKIVVMDLGVMDTLEAIGAKDAVKGVPMPDRLPDFLGGYSDVASVGSLFEPDMEEIAKIDPDLVIVAARSASLYQDLSKSYPTIDATISWKEPDYSERVPEQVRMIGEATGHADEAEQAAKDLEDKIAEYDGLASDKGSAIVVMTNGGEISLHGPQSRWAPIFDVLGFEPGFEEKADEGHKGQKVSFETVKEINPDYIFVVDRDAAIGEVDPGQTAEKVLDNDLVKATTAAQEDHIVYLTPDRWYLVMTGASNYGVLLDEIGDAVK